MDPGKLRHKVTIQQQGESIKDGYGALVENWTDVKIVSASVEPLSGRELFAAQQVHSEITTRIKTRYRAGITSKMRIMFGLRIYDILAPIDPEERHRELHLMCRELIP